MPRTHVHDRAPARRAVASPDPLRSGSGLTCLRRLAPQPLWTRARVHQFHGDDLLEIRLTPADSQRFATLTRKLARMPSPHNVLATVIGGQIVDHPVVIRAVTTRWVGFTGFPNRAAAEFALRSLLAGSRP